MCTSTCPQGGWYEPEREVILWCEQCARWYHRACVTPVGSVEEQRAANDATVKHAMGEGPAEDAHPGERLWDELLVLPVQRGWPQLAKKTPLSFEDITLKARIAERTGARPQADEVEGWIERRFQETMAVHSGQERRRAYGLLKRVLEMSGGKRIVYCCGTTGHRM